MLRPSTRRLGAVLALFMLTVVVRADNTAQTLPFSQDWTNTGLITATTLGGRAGRSSATAATTSTAATGTDPQTIARPTARRHAPVVDVNANQTNPNTFTTGGVAEFRSPTRSSP